MSEVNWSEIKIRCSSISCIMTDPVSKEAKAAGDLSKTCKSHLAKVYAWEKYGRRKDITSKYMEKGLLVEEDAITLLARVDKKLFQKNAQHLENEFIRGTPDIFEGESIENADVILDTKASWDLETFLANITEPLNKDYYYQVQGYMALTNAKRATVAFCLVNTPESLVNDEKRRLLYKMDVISEENAEYKRVAEEMEFNMFFDDIAKEERVLKFQVERNYEEILRIYEKVKKCRVYLEEFEQRHLNFNLKQ